MSRGVFAVAALAVIGVVAQDQQEPNVNTATAASSVYAAQATAVTDNQRHRYIPGRAFDRFVEIWLENTDYDKAAGDPNLAWLASKGLTLSNYYGVTHPSQPNYVAAVGGDNLGMDNDNFNQILDSNNVSVSTVVDLLEDRGISWGTYQEHMPYTGYEGYKWSNQETGANDYMRKHNPPIIFNKNTSPRRLSYQKNFTQFYYDLEQQNLPQWSFITPNMTNDGHDSSVQVAGNWARNFIEPLLSNSYFMERTLVLLTFDENHSYTIGNRVFSVLLGGAVPEFLEGQTDDHYYNHYSDIATVEANWGLHTLGRWDVGANVFGLVALQTGDIYRPNDAVTSTENPTEFQNSSFAGPFNSEFETAPYPIPNTNILSPFTFRSVLPAIRNFYGSKEQQESVNQYYNDGVVIPDGQHPPNGYAYNDVNN